MEQAPQRKSRSTRESAHEFVKRIREERELGAALERQVQRSRRAGSRGDLPGHVGTDDLEQDAAVRIVEARKPDYENLYRRQAAADAHRRDWRTPYGMSRLNQPLDDEGADTVGDLVANGRTQPDAAILVREARAELEAALTGLDPLRVAQLRLRVSGHSHQEISALLAAAFPDAAVGVTMRALQRWYVRWAESQSPPVQALVRYEPTPQRGYRAGAERPPSSAHAPAQRVAQPARTAEIRARASAAGEAIALILALRLRTAHRGGSFSWEDAADQIARKTGVHTAPRAAREAYAGFRRSLPDWVRSACP